MKGTSLTNLLQSVETEKKTCSVIAKSNGREGSLYYVSGELVEASYGEKEGTDAFQEIVKWEEAEVQVETVKRRKKKTVLSRKSRRRFARMKIHSDSVKRTTLKNLK